MMVTLAEATALTHRLQPVAGASALQREGDWRPRSWMRAQRPLLSRLPAVIPPVGHHLRADELGDLCAAAFLTVGDGAELTEERVIAAADEQLAKLKAPRSVVTVDPLPRNAAGKVLQRELGLSLASCQRVWHYGRRDQELSGVLSRLSPRIAAPVSTLPLISITSEDSSHDCSAFGAHHGTR